ncbi:hypothetical protein I2494_05205 [Budviciaceae bacterium BWR-B9]|uniref:Uncharacterized protein n=1 Tax=Limnobaculum allomyrinae TaxID=2791986 RepID=A0ABS1IN68_9GAMM|nr:MULTISPECIES: hypothetical protein [Limnobaculum]MBK5143119.1 hypothetical protein [Limnobaculum allomyrinae]MBV7691008.1 hypothetical protein [Limnobaculum sp. M2-1]
MKNTHRLFAIILSTTWLLLSAPAISASNNLKTTQLPLQFMDIYTCDTDCDSRYPMHQLSQLPEPLQQLINQQNQKNIYNLDGGEDDGYLFLPARGEVQILIAARSIVVNSFRLMTIKDHKLIDQQLIGFSGPDDTGVINFSIDKGYRLTIKRGISDIEHEKPVVWSEQRVYEISENGKLSEINK